MQKIIMQLLPRDERMVKRHRLVIRKALPRPKWLVRKRDSQLLGFLALPIILSLFTSESTTVYRILQDKALENTE